MKTKESILGNHLFYTEEEIKKIASTNLNVSRALAAMEEYAGQNKWIPVAPIQDFPPNKFITLRLQHIEEPHIIAYCVIKQDSGPVFVPEIWRATHYQILNEPEDADFYGKSPITKAIGNVKNMDLTNATTR